MQLDWASLEVSVPNGKVSSFRRSTVHGLKWTRSLFQSRTGRSRHSDLAGENGSWIRIYVSVPNGKVSSFRPKPSTPTFVSRLEFQSRTGRSDRKSVV